MTTSEEDDLGADPLVEKRIFPDAEAIFSFRPPSMSAVKDRCVVVLDTNVLLVPYTISARTLDQIGQTYESLSRALRLVVPAHVAREFAKNRAQKLGELFQQLKGKRDGVKGLQVGKYPLLADIAEYQAVVALESQINDQLREYGQALATLVQRVKDWNWDDPVSLLYSRLFTSGVVVEASITDEDLLKDLAARAAGKCPPGYKDSSKTTNSAGDLIIWHTILEIGRSRRQPVLFVSGDGKSDWWYRSAGEALYPRYELTDEFRRASGGEAFFILSFSDFLDLFGAQGDVVDEVREKEAEQEARRPMDVSQGVQTLLGYTPVLSSSTFPLTGSDQGAALINVPNIASGISGTLIIDTAISTDKRIHVEGGRQIQIQEIMRNAGGGQVVKFLRFRKGAETRDLMLFPANWRDLSDGKLATYFELAD